MPSLFSIIQTSSSRHLFGHPNLLIVLICASCPSHPSQLITISILIIDPHIQLLTPSSYKNPKTVTYNKHYFIYIKQTPKNFGILSENTFSNFPKVTKILKLKRAIKSKKSNTFYNIDPPPPPQMCVF